LAGSLDALRRLLHSASGIHIVKNSGKNLKGGYLLLISLVYLIVALLLILGFIPPQEPRYWWSSFWTLLPPVILSTAILNVTLLVGHSRKEIIKIHPEYEH